MTKALRIIAYLLMTTLALLVSVLASQYLFLPPEQAAPPPLRDIVIARHNLFMIHAGGGIVALLAGAWNLLEFSRRRFPNLHRYLGRAYFIGVVSSSLAGLSLSFTAQGGLTARVGFALLAISWLVTAIFAYIRIREYDLQSHREWITRNYALTLSAVTLRLWLPILIISGYDFSTAYPLVAWLAWVPNLIVAEIIVGRLKPKQLQPTSLQEQSAT